MGWNHILNACVFIPNFGPEIEFDVQENNATSASVQYTTHLGFFGCFQVLSVCTFLILLSSVLLRLVLIILNQAAIEEIQKMTLWLFYFILLSCNKIHFKEKKTRGGAYQNWISCSLQLPQGQISTYVVFIIMQLISHNICRYGDNKIMIAGITNSVFLTCLLECIAGVEVAAKRLLKGDISKPGVGGWALSLLWIQKDKGLGQPFLLRSCPSVGPLSVSWPEFLETKSKE